MAELRYNGKLVERFPDSDTQTMQAIATKRGTGWTVSADLPVAVYCRGNLVESFATAAEAQAYVASRTPPPAPRRLPAPASPWTIVPSA